MLNTDGQLRTGFDNASATVATKVGSSLVVTMPPDLDETAMQQVWTVVFAGIQEREITSLILEFSGVKLMDGYEFGRLKELAKTAYFLGTKTIFVGLNAGIISHLALSNVDLTGVTATLTLDALARVTQ